MTMSFRPQQPMMGQPPLPMIPAPFNPNQHFGVRVPVGVPNMPPNMPMPPLPVGALPPPPVMPPGMMPPPIMRPTQSLLPTPTSSSTQNSSSGSSTVRNSSGRSYRNDKAISDIGGKVTTVFVGNITERASDALVRQILMKCGYISNWKRVQGATGRLQAFGFCEYANADAALRSIRLLSDFQLGEKKLLVKVDSKTRIELDEYKLKKKEEKEKEGGVVSEDYDVETDSATKAVDKSSKEDINRLVQDNHDVLCGKYEDSLPYMKKSHSGSTENLEGLDMDHAKKNLVSKEIRIFREAYRNEDKDKDKDKDKKDKDRDRERERERDRRRDRERRSDKERRKSDVHGEGERERRGSSRDPTASADRSKRVKDEESKERQKERNVSDDEDDYEKRRLDRKRREKDQLFLERLKEWEARERKRSRDYEKQYMKDEKKKSEQNEERQHLAEFLEDYDDDQDDPKYYRSNAFSRRYRDREIELESDSRDRKMEAEELESARRMQAKRGLHDKENEVPKIAIPSKVPISAKKENTPPPSKFQAALVPTFSNLKAVEVVQPPTQFVPTATVATVSPTRQSTDTMTSHNNARDYPAVAPPIQAVAALKRDYSLDEDSMSPAETSSKKTTFGFGMKTNQLSQQANNKKFESVFNANEDEMKGDAVPKKKLTRLDDEDGGSSEHQNGSAESQAGEEKKKIIRELIEKIPTGKDELFAYELKWEMVDQGLIDRRIKPWVNKKIFQYIGEEEQTLVEFVCGKVLTKCVPKNILEDVSMVLDDEAEVFVVKMWRLLIYETEAKSLGLLK